MYVYEPIKMVCMYLNLDDCLTELNAVMADMTANTNQHALNQDSINYSTLNNVQKKLYALIQYAGVSCDEVATEYFPLISTEAVSTSENGNVLFSAFNKQVKKIISIDIDGHDIKFDVMHDCIKTHHPNSSISCTYEYFPTYPVNMKSKLDVCANVTKRIIAFKIASEFCLVKNLYDEYSFWERKFFDTITHLKSAISSKKIKSKPLY